MSDSENLEALSEETNGDEGSGKTSASSPDTLRILEAVLFASDEPLALPRLVGVVEDGPQFTQ